MGERLVGTFVSAPDPVLAELLGQALDVIVLDMEHSAISLRDAHLLTLAAQGAGCAVLVRIPSDDTELVTPLLDAGVDGLVVPRVESAEQARAFAARLRYPPDGTRGYGPRRANRYGRDAEYWRGAREQIACVVQIESAAGVEAVEQIAAVDGVDCLLVGPADLSFELGVPLQSFARPLLAAIARSERAAAVAGVAFSLASNVPPARLAELVGDCRLLLQGTDLRLYASAVDAAAADARGALAALRAAAQPA
ncbi:MAG TPA: aldolase/citrate lyase family protein [Solirubrobacteraceae bacterium]